MYKLFVAIKEDLKLNQQEVRLRELELTSKEREVFLANEVLIKEKVVSEKKLQFAFLVIFVFMIVIGVILLLLRRIRIKEKVLRKQKEILEQTNKDLDAMNQENSFLLKEVNHRVKNNLAFITDLIVHHRDLEEDVKSKMKLQDLSGRINALVFAQKDLLPFKKGQEGNGQSLRFFAFDLMESLININTQAIVLDVDIADVVLNIDTLVPLGLILNELPSNSSKHAVLESKTSLKIDVQIKIQKEKILITYKDNGLNKLNKKKQQNSGMGMFILEGMVQQLKGSLNVESFQYQICLKIKK